MSEKNKIPVVPRPLSIEETYAQRPRRWWLYTLVVIIVALLLVWSASGVEFKGIATKGSEVARGIATGLTHPDWNLLLGRITEDTSVTEIAGITISTEGVPYLLFQTIAIAFLVRCLAKKERALYALRALLLLLTLWLWGYNTTLLIQFLT